ncbi:MAG TPA: hypothetical protein VGX48_19050 [Pyrinomonadaceae bacterium]|jgi:hypothetical protein|nr:hypothetical protein [Pyrinomonadaceae bacterium]
MTSQGSHQTVKTFLLACSAVVLLAASAAAQTKPISREGLVKSVRINGLTTRELVSHIQRRGVAFEMTPDAEAELRGAGARPEVIEAARSNYRPAADTPSVAARPAPATTTTARPVSPSLSSVPDGPALSKSEIVTMLQGGIAPARVEQFVEKRGVNFRLTRDDAQEITAAGGNRSLIGAITEKAPEETAGSGNNNSSAASPFAAEPAASGAPTYDDFIDRATSAMSARDFPGAIRFAQQAVQLDPQQPQAYSIIGTLSLYYSQNVAAAEQAMRAAIERGGAAVFHVYHDHNGNFSQYCEGSFFVSKDGVQFKANDGQDTFETADANIKEAKTNAFVGSEVGAFHIKPVQKINGRDNFNFAPLSRQKAEAQLIIRIIQAF